MTEGTHDPLCPVAGTEPAQGQWIEIHCRCDLIGRVRSDEREKKEALVIEEIDNDPFDALRFAIDLHMNRHTAAVRSHDAILQARRHVLEDADAFLEWLRAKKKDKE